MVDATSQPPDGALPFSDVTSLLDAAARAEKQQALVARVFVSPRSDCTTCHPVDQYTKLSSIASQLRDFVQRHTRKSDYLDGKDYIWHREPPSISVVCPPSSSRATASTSRTQQPPHILFHLRTGGECVEDEWFATHLLIRASTHFAEHQLCISVQDEDGQFLLIEAAEYLPDWVTPEAVANRVWIFDGHLHLVPPYHKTGQDGFLAVGRAVELVTDTCTLTRASDDMEAAAFARAFEFPSAAQPHHHRTLAYLPRCIAKVLAAEPQLIADCITSIQSRDVVSSRSGSRLVHFPPPPQPQHSSGATPSDTSTTSQDNDVVLTSVRMTRHLYALILYDRFFPPRQLGPHWQAAVEKYRLGLYHPTSSSFAQTKVKDEEQMQLEMQHGRWHDVGAKIWCGMEMAYTESLSRRTRTKARSMAASQTAMPEQEREKLVSSLTKLGYFQGEMEGSAKWKQLQEAAIAQYSEASSGCDDGSQLGKADALLCDTVDRILENTTTSTQSSTILPRDASPASLKAAEDDDSWLQLGPDDIDSILQTKTNTATSGPHPIDEHDTFQRLGAFNDKMQDFIKTKSDVRGAVFEDELDAQDMQLEDEDLLFEDLDEQEQEQRVREEVRDRMRSGGQEEKRKLVERLLPRISDDEWLRKPNTHVEEADNKDDFISSIDRIAAERSAPVPAQPGSDSNHIATRDSSNLAAAHTQLRRRLASQYMRETSTLLSSQSHARFDGASDSDDEELEQETSPAVRRKLAEEYDVEPDDAAGSGEEAPWEDAVGPGEDPHLDEETELANLVEYARISLGLTREQYERILDERRQTGKYVPPTTSHNLAAPAGRATAPKLDTFESVMSAMEDQLRASSSASANPDRTQPNPAAPEHAIDAEDTELLSHLLNSDADLPSSLLSHLGSDAKPEQIESFLRSFAAQADTSGVGAGSGPVDVLMRRFGLGGLPADSDSRSQT